MPAGISMRGAALMGESYDARDIDHYIMAQVYALKVAVFFLLDAASLPPDALKHFDAISEEIKANVLNRSLPDSFYDDFEKSLAALRRRLQLR